MNLKENALRIINFDSPERVVTGCPTHGIAYRGYNHEGYTGGGHHLPVGSRWTDIWGTGWYRAIGLNLSKNCLCPVGIGWVDFRRKKLLHD